MEPRGEFRVLELVGENTLRWSDFSPGCIAVLLNGRVRDGCCDSGRSPARLGWGVAQVPPARLLLPDRGPLLTATLPVSRGCPS